MQILRGLFNAIIFIGCDTLQECQIYWLRHSPRMSETFAMRGDISTKELKKIWDARLARRQP